MLHLSTIIIAALTVVLQVSAAGNEEDARLEKYFREFLEKRFELHPLEATRLGDHRFDHRLDDLSPEARKRSVALTKSVLERLPRQIEYKRLSRAGQVDYEILEHELKSGLWLEENIRPFETNPRVYNEYISDSVFQLLAQSPLPLATNVANAVGRIGYIPQITAAAKRNMKNPPRPSLETAIRQNLGSIAFYEGDIFKIAGDLSPAQSNQLRSAAQAILPALKEYQGWLTNSLLPRASEEWRLGKRKFAKKLELTLDAGISAEEVLRDARREFARVTDEMYLVSRQLWSRYYPGKALPPDDTKGRREVIQKVLEAVNQEHGKPEELVADARGTVEAIRTFIREQKILRLPEPDRCDIIEMPEFQRGNSVAYLNAAPPLEPDARSLYAISPPLPEWGERRINALLEEYNSHMLQVLTIHEAYPGHYVQLEYSNRAGSLIRRVLQSGVYIEGWAVYTEQTMLDQGYGKGDLRLRLMQLKFYLRAVGNAILDHQLHCENMSDQEAFEFLTEDAFQSEEEARQKVVRAKQTSVQLSTYFVGRMAMYRLRQQTQRALGQKFDLARYHEAVLNQGSVPVKYLPELVSTALGER